MFILILAAIGSPWYLQMLMTDEGQSGVIAMATLQSACRLVL